MKIKNTFNFKFLKNKDTRDIIRLILALLVFLFGSGILFKFKKPPLNTSKVSSSITLKKRADSLKEYLKLISKTIEDADSLLFIKADIDDISRLSKQYNEVLENGFDDYNLYLTKKEIEYYEK